MARGGKKLGRQEGKGTHWSKRKRIGEAYQRFYLTPPTMLKPLDQPLLRGHRVGGTCGMFHSVALEPVYSTLTVYTVNGTVG